MGMESHECKSDLGINDKPDGIVAKLSPICFSFSAIMAPSFLSSIQYHYNYYAFWLLLFFKAKLLPTFSSNDSHEPLALIIVA
jgi:hypothetical protein